MPDVLGLTGPDIAVLLGKKFDDCAAIFDEHNDKPQTPRDAEKRERAILYLAIGEVIAENNRCIQEELQAAGVLPAS